MTRPPPAVTVVIPTYQRGDVIERAIGSVLGQDETNLELIVVDDGSTDGTRDIVTSIADDRLRYLETTHVGAAAARNLGARTGRGRWLTFLDSDDTVVPDWLASLLGESEVPGTVLVSCGYVERMDGTEAILRQPLPRQVSPAVGRMIALIETGGSYLVDRALFLELGGFDPAQPAAQHLELALRLGPVITERRLRCGTVARPLVERWVGRDDHIRSDDAAVLAGAIRILERHRDRLVLDRPFLADSAATAAYRAVRLGRFAEARRLAAIAVRSDPRNLRHWARLALVVVPGAAKRYAGRSRTEPARTRGGP